MSGGAVTFDDLLAVLAVLTVEQQTALAEALPIPKWAPGTVMEDCAAGGTAQVLLDRDVATATQAIAVNTSGHFLAAGSRVQCRASGNVLEVESVLDAGFPPGVLLPYGGSTEPAWGVFANGQSLPTSAPYNRLAKALGLDTSSTFTVPDASDRTIIVKGSTFSTLLAVGGAFSRTITQANLPAATLAVTITDPGHRHYDGDDTGANTAASGAARQEPGAGTAGSKRTSTETTGITASAALGGSGTALDTTPKYLVTNAVWTL